MGLTGSDGLAAAEAARRQHPGLTRELALTLRWQAAESRIYPLVMADPELYQAAVGLVVAAREVLRKECHTFEAVEQLSVDGILHRCEQAESAVANGVDVATAVDAARAMRWREISTAAARAEDGAQPGSALP